MNKKWTLLVCIVAIIISCSDKAKQSKAEAYEWKYLLDENLSMWDTYLSFKHKVTYDGSHPVDSLGNKIEPVGLNKPGYDVFSVFSEKNEPILKVTGEYYGALATKDVFENYHFQLKFRWGDIKWDPRKTKMKDSGVLYHSNGAFGAEYWRSWMLSQEFQIMEAHTGDFWSQATSSIDIRAYASESGLNPMAHKSQDYLSFGEGGEAGNYCMRSTNNEKDAGEWNTLDLICYNGNSLHIVNGEVVMVLKNSRYLNEQGEMISLHSGKIQLQSEAAELFFKDIKIRLITQLEPKYSRYF